LSWLFVWCRWPIFKNNWCLISAFLFCIVLSLHSSSFSAILSPSYPVWEGHGGWCLLGMCRNWISVWYRFLKTWTEPNRSQKVKPEISVSVFRGFSQNRTSLIQIVNIWAILTNTMWFKLKFKLNFKKKEFETSWACRKPSTEMQNAHTKKDSLHVFCNLQLIYKENQTDGFFKTERKPKPNSCFFSQNRTELEKSISHIPSVYQNIWRETVRGNQLSQVNMKGWLLHWHVRVHI